MVTLTSGLTVHGLSAEEDLRRRWRHGRCRTCESAVGLADARILFRSDSANTVETFSYYCPECQRLSEPERGRLLGHDDRPILDELGSPGLGGGRSVRR